MKLILSTLLLLPSIVLADGYARGQLQEWLPGYNATGLDFGAGAPSITGNATVIDADDEASACIFQAPATGSLDAFHWRITTHTTGGDLDSRAESVSATTGDYSGTLLGTNTNCTITTSGTGVVTCDFTAEPSVTKGQLLAAVLKRQSGTANDTISAGVSSGTGHAFPYPESFIGGVTTKHPQRSCNVAVEYSGQTPYYPIQGVLPAVFINSLSVASNTSPDEVGNVFNFPAPVKVCGVKVLDNNPSTVDFDVKLWDTDGITALASFTVDGNIQASSGTLENGTYMFSSPVPLRANASYRASVVPGTTTSISFYDIQVGTANMLQQIFGPVPSGTRIYKTSRADAATTWTDDTSRVAWLDLVICGVLVGN